MRIVPSVPLHASSSQYPRYSSSRIFTYDAGPLHSMPPAPLSVKMIHDSECGVV